MYKFDEICELIRLIGSTGVASVELEQGGSRVRIEGAPKAMIVANPLGVEATAAAPVPVAAAPAATLSAAGSTDAEPAAADSADLHAVTSPIVGTFYRAPNPDAEPYVKVGDFVEKGQVLCIVEAMKLMNEIESDAGGTIVKVMPENEQPVEYGEQLFLIRPN